MEDQKNIVGIYQTRRFEPGELELRIAGGKEKRLLGYAAVFGVLSEEMFGFREKIAPGAFAESIKRDDIRCLWNHEPGEVLGRNKSGTLKLWEDSKGLGFEVSLPDTQRAHDLVESIKRKDVTQNSFGFMLENVRDESWSENRKVRTLNKLKLFDVSPVTYAAYPQTELSVRYYLANNTKPGLSTVQPVRSSRMSDREFEARIGKTLSTMRKREFKPIIDYWKNHIWR
jgi:uncharacterized protein